MLLHMKPANSEKISGICGCGGGEMGLLGVLQIYRLTRGARSRVDRVQRSSFIGRVLMLLSSALFYKV